MWISEDKGKQMCNSEAKDEFLDSQVQTRIQADFALKK